MRKPTKYEIAIALTDIVEAVANDQVAKIKAAAFYGCCVHVRKCVRGDIVYLADHATFDMALRCMEPWQIRYLTNLSNHPEL